MNRKSSRPAILLASALLLTTGRDAPGAETVRMATFNVSLYGERAGKVPQRLETGQDPKIRRLAEIIQRARPDILLLNEFDYDPDGENLKLFCEKYLAVGQNASASPGGAAEPIEFAHRYAAETNTGEHSGIDLNRDGIVDSKPGSDAYAADCWGYGRYPGQYAFVLLSRYPIDTAAVRTFRKFLWKDMPGAQLPDDPQSPGPDDWYPAEAIEQFRLSSKNHCDVPVVIDGRRVHLLLSHPTPPVYDGPEDRNGRRNHDELRLWKDYIEEKAVSGKRKAVEQAAVSESTADGRQPTASYLVDDAGEPSGLPAGESFVILGDLNGDPFDGDGPEGISELLSSPRILRYPLPQSAGAEEQSRLQGGANVRHRGDPRCDTCDPADNPGPGNLHIDYVLPSADIRVKASGVFWPLTTDPLFPLVAGAAEPASSDHRLVWADVELPPDTPKSEKNGL